MLYLDDSIMQKGKPATAGSKMLENFIAPFDATVIARLDDEKMERLPLGEFGLSAPGRLPLGEGARPNENPAFLLCSDIFGFVRAQAVKQGLCSIRPTYGTVSRYGLIPAACSMDQIGLVCQNPPEGFDLLARMAGHDEKDGAMFPEKSYRYASEKENIRWGAHFSADGAESRAAEAFLQSKGVAEYEKHTEDCLSVAGQVMNILAYAEIAGNLSRYDGIKFGHRAQNYRGLEALYTKSRTEGFGTETKLAILIGCMVLSQDYYKIYYEKAMKIRRLIRDALCFGSYDVLALPVGSPLAVLAGLPSLTFGDGLGGVQLVAPVKQEGVLLAAWRALQ